MVSKEDKLGNGGVASLVLYLYSPGLMITFKKFAFVSVILILRSKHHIASLRHPSILK
jgi:hypothetical protein